MQQFFNHPAHHRTGGIFSRDMAIYACLDSTARACDVAHVIMAGGPIDACDVIQAGACDSITWADAHGHMRASVSGIARA